MFKTLFRKKIPGNLNHRLVNIIAADVFWIYAYKFSFQEANSYALKGAFPKEMLSKKIIENMLLNYTKDIPDIAITAYYEAVKQEIINHAKAERNLMGIIFEEDIPNARTIDFNEFDRLNILKHDADNAAPYQINISPSNLIPVIGELMVRTPLPSVVISPQLPTASCILVKSTAKALDFQKTMIMQINSMQELSIGYVLEGYFHIPTTRNNGVSNHWNKLIPNSFTFLKSTKIYYDSRTNVTIDII